MREIKFRAWHKGQMYYQGFQRFLGSYGCQFTQFDETPESLMQYTGLKDKNGVQIYEGDLINYTGFDKKRHTARVFWKDDECRFFAKIRDMQARFTLSATTPQGTDTDLEVIGNIYSNPELLSKEPLKENTTHE